MPLIVHKEDVQELSSVPLPEQCSKDECVGTLLVHQSDVQELSTSTTSSTQQPPSLAKRFTEAFTKPAPTSGDSEAEQEAEWAYRDI